MSIVSELKKMTPEGKKAVEKIAPPLESLLKIGNFRQKKQAAALLADLHKSI